MPIERYSGRHSDEQQREYEREIRLQYGPDTVNESIRRWNGYSEDQRDAILSEAGRIYEDIMAAMTAGMAATDAYVQTLLERWHDNLRFFYEPTLEVLRGLGEMYNTDPRFQAFFAKIHPDLAAYLQTGIAQYVDGLETAEIERMLNEDEAAQRLGR